MNLVLAGLACPATQVICFPGTWPHGRSVCPGSCHKRHLPKGPEGQLVCRRHVKAAFGAEPCIVTPCPFHHSSHEELGVDATGKLPRREPTAVDLAAQAFVERKRQERKADRAKGRVKQIENEQTGQASHTKHESSLVHFRYLDEFVHDLDCAGELLKLRLFPDAKEITQAMAAFNAVRQHLISPKGPIDLRDNNVQCVVVGDGSTPRTAALFAFRTGWTCWAVDPAMRDGQWSSVERLHPVGAKIQDFSLPEGSGPVVAVLMHAHVSLEDVAKALILRQDPVSGMEAKPKQRVARVKENHRSRKLETKLEQLGQVLAAGSEAGGGRAVTESAPHPSTSGVPARSSEPAVSTNANATLRRMAVLACPCCNYAESQAVLLGRAPDVEYEDVSLVSSKRLLRLWLP